MGHASKERVVLIGTDQRITSGPAAKRLHSKAGYMAAPERFAKKSDSFPLHRGRRPYMAQSVSAAWSRLRLFSNEQRTQRRVHPLGPLLTRSSPYQSRPKLVEKDDGFFPATVPRW